MGSLTDSHVTVMEFPALVGSNTELRKRSHVRDLHVTRQRRNAVFKTLPKQQQSDEGHHSNGVARFRKANKKLILANKIRSRPVRRPKYKAQTHLVAMVRSALMRAVLKWRTYNKDSNTGYPTNLNELKQLVETDPEAAKDGVVTVKMVELFEFRAFIDTTP